MKRFQNQRLTKAEMNRLHGGLSTKFCSCYSLDGEQEYLTWFLPADASAEEIVASIDAHCQDGSRGTCTNVSV